MIPLEKQNWYSDVDHNSADQQKRQKSASGKKLTPVSIDRDAETASFEGSGKSDYKTTLAGCTCGDFVRRHTPCKHMYRLAHELGRFDLSSQGAVQSGHLKRDAPHTVDEVAQLLPEEEARFLKHELYGVVIMKSPLDDFTVNHDAKINISTLISLGLVLDVPVTPECAVDKLTIPQLKGLLDEAGIAFDKKLKKADIASIVLSSIPDVAAASFAAMKKYDIYRLNPAYEGIFGKLYHRFTKMYPEEKESFYNPVTGKFEYSTKQVEEVTFAISFGLPENQ